jgi:hypothetical protein
MLVNIIYYKPKVPRLVTPMVVVNGSVIGAPTMRLPGQLWRRAW